MERNVHHAKEDYEKGEEMSEQGFIDYLEAGYDVEHVSGGKQLKLNGQCPFCGEDRRDMRMYVNVTTGLGQCFHCGEPFGPHKFIMAREGCSIDVAKQIAKGDPEGWERTDAQPEVDPDLVWPHSTPIDESPEAATYLFNRNISHRLVKHFGLYFSAHMTKIGSKVYHTENRIVIPIFDINGQPVSWQARTIGGAIPKYLFPPAFKGGQVLYNAWSIPVNAEYLIICEGVMDVFGWWRHGATNVVATFGKKISEDQVALLRHINPKLVFIAWDSDAMMENFSFAEKYGHILNTRIVDLKGRDADECSGSELTVALQDSKRYSWDDKIICGLSSK